MLSPLLRLNNAVKGRLAVMDEALSKKREEPRSSLSFPAYMKLGTYMSYYTGSPIDTSVPQSVLNTLKGIMDENKVRFLNKSRVAFTFNELEPLFKSAHRQLEIWSFVTSAMEVLADGFVELKNKLSDEDKHVADKYASFLKCIDKAGRHGIGEAVHAFSNLLLKKREHVLNMTKRGIEPCQKAPLLYAPMSSFKLFVPELVKDVTKDIKDASQTSALVNVARPQSHGFF